MPYFVTYQQVSVQQAPDLAVLALPAWLPIEAVRRRLAAGWTQEVVVFVAFVEPEL